MSLQPILAAEIMPEATLEDCERIFRQGDSMEKQGQLQQGLALLHIRDTGLYKQTHGTFEEYVEDRLRIVRTRGYQLISLATVVQEMSTNVDTPAITNEGQARAIKPVLRDHGPEVAAEVLREAASDGKVTARSITEAASRVVRVEVEPQPAPESVVPVVVESEPVEVLTSEEWMQREGYEQASTDPDPDDFLPEQSRFEKRFWQHLRQAQELAKDLDYPHHFTEPMFRMVADVIQTLSSKQTSMSGHGLRVVNGGKQ